MRAFVSGRIHRAMSRDRTPHLTLSALVAALLVAALLVAGSSASAGPAPGAVASGSPHEKGRYQGKVGTFARIIFNASGSKVKKLNAGVQGSCQRASTGQITRVELVAMRTKKKLKIKGNGKFEGKGQEDNGVAWEIKGRFTSAKKAKGTFEASKINFFPITFDSELCAGSGKWKAKLK